MTSAALVLVAVGAGTFASFVARAVGLRCAFVSAPHPLVVTHTEPVPYLGGLAVAAGALVALAALGRVPGVGGAVLVAGLLFLAIGLFDDLFPLAPGRKLVLQAAAVAALVSLGLGLPVSGFPAVNALAGAIWILTIANAVNVTDVCDGLVAGLAAVAFFAFAAIEPTSRSLALATAGACLGFLAFNAPPASIFRKSFPRRLARRPGTRPARLGPCLGLGGGERARTGRPALRARVPGGSSTSTTRPLVARVSRSLLAPPPDGGCFALADRRNRVALGLWARAPRFASVSGRHRRRRRPQHAYCRCGARRLAPAASLGSRTLTSRTTPASPHVDFLVGTARSGTTWIGRVLSHHPDLAVFGETSFFGRLYVSPRSDGLYGRRELRAVIETQVGRDWRATTRDTEDVLSAASYAVLVREAVAALEPPIAPVDVFLTIAGVVARSEGKRRVLEKTPHHVHWLAEIADLFPDARFVLAVRDPYEFVVSLRHQGNRLSARTDRLLDAPWRHPLIAALAWRGYMRSMERALERCPNRIHVVRTEDLRLQPRSAVDRIQAFLGLEAAELPVDLPPINSSFAVATMPPLRGEDLFWLNLVAGSLITRFGYEAPPTARESLRTLASALTAPASLAATAVRLPAMVRRPLRDYVGRWLGVNRA
jgi:hypothetical protein